MAFLFWLLRMDAPRFGAMGNLVLNAALEIRFAGSLNVMKEKAMSAPKDLKDLYLEELQDLWSANDQMKGIVERMATEVDDASLGDRLRRSAEGVEKHSRMLRDLISGAGGQEEKEHCKAMEGLVAEARRHALESGAKGSVKDVAIIAQYQRMCHYGIAGFGTAKAYAEALGKSEHAQKLDQALKHIYQSDEYMSELAERSKNMQAAR